MGRYSSSSSSESSAATLLVSKVQVSSVLSFDVWSIRPSPRFPCGPALCKHYVLLLLKQRAGPVFMRDRQRIIPNPQRDERPFWQEQHDTCSATSSRFRPLLLQRHCSLLAFMAVFRQGQQQRSLLASSVEIRESWLSVLTNRQLLLP